MAKNKGRKVKIDVPGNLPDVDAAEKSASESAGSDPADSITGSQDENVTEAADEAVEDSDGAEVLEPEILEPETAEVSDATPADAESTEDAADSEGVEPDDIDVEEVVKEAARIVDEGDSGTKEKEDDLLSKAKQEAADAKDRYVRLQAEWDNYRKRTAGEREQERERAAERVVKDLLPAIDDIERALAHAKETPDMDLSAFVEGVAAAHTKMMDALAKEKLEAIDPAGEAFDANKHQAVGSVDDDTVPDETVMQVYQKGYEMAGHVLRPAMVTVSTGGPKREPEETPQT